MAVELLSRNGGTRSPQARGVALCRLARISEDKGNRDAAEAYYREALEVDFRNYAFPGLVQGRYLNPKSDQALIEQAIVHASILSPAQEQINFALGQVFDSAQDYDLAFEMFERGNALARLRLGPFDMAKHVAQVEARVRVFSSAFFRQVGAAASSSRFRIFIAGMPRSGTTLTEQVLSAHSTVAAGGELTDIASWSDYSTRWGGTRQRYPECLQRVDPAVLQTLSLSMASTARAIAFKAGKSRLVTKLPHDIFDLGLISLLFPNSPVIHIRRNPLDVALSCYMQGFQSLKWATSFESITTMLRSYRRIVRHWSSVLSPESVYELKYESLVESPESEISNILDYLNLKSESPCFRSHLQHRPITTPSRWQVRQPINTDSVGRWKHYRDAIGPALPHLKEFYEDYS
ncbi:MAG: sulfotransferase [Fuerstiella sp.]